MQKSLFELNYQTREASHDFLKLLQSDEIKQDNIDFYYISTAYKTIWDWFESKENFDTNNFESKFTFNTQVIWYESKEEDSISIFTRLNIGKIPLTNAELIKALFLNSSNFKEGQTDRIRLKQLEISTEWDYIENALQDDRLWYFINIDNILTNRIEFIFNLMNTETDKSDNYSTFRFFNKKFQNKTEKTVEDNWLKIKSYFQKFQEWFNERELYHKIGFLLTEGETTILALIDESNKRTKKDFKSYLNDAIKKRLKNVSLENLQYGDSLVKTVLLLYNIQTMINNEKDNSFFPFDLFKTGKWDIEHITSVKDKIPSSEEHKNNWLKDASKFIEDEDKDLKDKIESCDMKNNFNEVYEEVIKYFNKDLKDNDINDISNLALLDSETNRGYKNAVFPQKRMTIIKREKKGTFIPLCTKNAFLKYFSAYPPKMSFWTQEDRDNYYKDIERVINVYLPMKEGADND
jgi:hypothetical protein